MYENITNRGEVTKERIKNAATRGVYVFKRDVYEDRCSVEMSYETGKGNNKYDLTELQDLRGRALLIAKQEMATSAVKETIREYEEDRADGVMMEFVNQVDLVHQIINFATKLMELGHFFYRKFQAVTRTSKEMSTTLGQLKEDLEKWQV